MRQKSGALSCIEKLDNDLENMLALIEHVDPTIRGKIAGYHLQMTTAIKDLDRRLSHLEESQSK